MIIMRKEYRDLLLSKNILVINEQKENTIIDAKEVGAILFSISSLGYTLDTKSIELLKHYSINSLKEFYFNTIETLKRAKGANVEHIVFYNNFPNIKHIKKEEYVLRAILHYYTASSNNYGYLAQDIKKEARPYLKDISKLKVLTIIEEQEAYKLLTDLATSMLE